MTLRGFIYYLDRYPIQVVSFALGFCGFAPYIFVPIRQSLGLKTNQYDKRALESTTERWLRLRKTDHLINDDVIEEPPKH